MSVAPEALRGRRVLLVEDDYLVAETMRDALEEMGMQVLGPFGWVEEALVFIEANPGAFDTAVIDINLHGAQSYPIADLLSARKIHFVFTTGYSSGAISERFRAYPRCEKPISRAALAVALAGSA
jgi:ActR/RegA family two-component response regulator